MADDDALDAVSAPRREWVLLAAWVFAVGVLPGWMLLSLTVAQVMGRPQATMLAPNGELIVVDGGRSVTMVEAAGVGLVWVVAIAAVVLPLAYLFGALRPRSTAIGDVLDDALVDGASMVVTVRRGGSAEDVVAVDAAQPSAPSVPEAPPVPVPVPDSAWAPPPPSTPVDGDPTLDDADDDLDDLFRS